MILFKVSLFLNLVCYLFFLILDPFNLSVDMNTTLTSLSCKIEARVNLSSVCQRCCTKEKVPEKKSSCQSMLFYCVDNIDKKHGSVVIWLLFMGSCRDRSFSLASNPILSRICKAYSDLVHCHVFLHTFFIFQRRIFVLTSGYLL